MAGWGINTLQTAGSANACPFEHRRDHRSPCRVPQSPAAQRVDPPAVLASQEGCRKRKIACPGPDLLDQNPHFDKDRQATWTDVHVSEAQAWGHKF